jgi:excisionase family DNA binding protein
MTQNPSRHATAQPACFQHTVSSDSNPFLTPEQAANFLGGMNPRTLTRWAREGLIPAYPMGEGKRRLWRFRREDLQEWMLARRSGPQLLASTNDRRTLVPATDASERRIIQ